MKIEIDERNRVKVEGQEPCPEDYCLTEDTSDLPENNADNWPIWYAELSDYRTAAIYASETVDARYRAWRGKFEETIATRYSKVPPAHSIKREVESAVKFFTFKSAIADANRLTHRYEGWRTAIEQRINLHIANS